MARANRALTLLNDELFVEVIDGLKADLIARWIASADDQLEQRERLYQQVHLLDIIHHNLKIIAGKGGQAQRDLQELLKKPRPFTVV